MALSTYHGPNQTGSDLNRCRITHILFPLPSKMSNPMCWIEWWKVDAKCMILAFASESVFVKKWGFGESREKSKKTCFLTFPRVSKWRKIVKIGIAAFGVPKKSCAKVVSGVFLEVFERWAEGPFWTFPDFDPKSHMSDPKEVRNWSFLAKMSIFALIVTSDLFGTRWS